MPLPISLRIQGRLAAIVGGGDAALRNARALIEAGARVRIIAPHLEAAMRALITEQNGELYERDFEPGDLDSCAFVVVATNDPVVNATVVTLAQVANTLVCDATQPEHGDATMPVTVRIGDLTFTVDSGASTPAYAKRLAREIREHFDTIYADAGRTLALMREITKATLPPEQRAEMLRALAELPIAALASMSTHAIENEVELMHRSLFPEPTLMRRSVICATRKSPLALAQTKLIAARLAEHGVASLLLQITTTGDAVTDRPIAGIGSENVFVKEIEQALLEGHADYAVHSAKDLPSTLDDAFRIVAISEREDARDVFCSERFASFAQLPSGACVGTSSPRRHAQLLALRSDLRYEPIRGNVDTRLRKLRDGEYDAIVLAAAGLRRLGIEATYTAAFSLDELVPAVGQGALAIETRADDDALGEQLRAAANDAMTEYCVTCERAALRALHAGCNTPIGIHARFEGAVMVVNGMNASSDGATLRVVERAEVTSLEAAQRLGEHVAEQLRRAPLRNRIFLVARTQPRPSRIAAALRAQGATVVEFHGGDDPGLALEAGIPDALLFPSSGSVEAAKPLLTWLSEKTARPLVFAMGPQSQEAAEVLGWTPDCVAREASIEAFVALVGEYLQR